MSTSSPAIPFRPELQTLRAVAVTGVVVYHLNPDLLPGGFLGVDVFFVLSGFLMGAILVSEFRDTGRISVSAFLARRARRLLPLSLTVILSTLAVSALLKPVTETVRYAWDATWSALGVANVAFAINGTDYFTTRDADTPFLHFWSLSVEEQYYVLLAFVGYGVWTLSTAVLRRSGASPTHRGRRIAAVIPFVLLGIIGLVITLLGDLTSAQQFYLLPLRAGQLALGGVVAALLISSPAPRGEGRPAAWGWPIGLAGIGFAFLVGDFAGGAVGSLIATASAAILVGTSPRDSDSFTLLARPPILAIGRWSYGIYLWHWPIVVFLPQVTGAGSLDEVAPTVMIASVIATVLISALSWRFVESPSQRVLAADRRTSRFTLMAAAVMITVTATVSSGTAALVPAALSAPHQLSSKSSPPASLAELVMTSDLNVPVSRSLTPGLFAPMVSPFDGERFQTVTPCHANEEETELVGCVDHASDGQVDVWLVGDSHALQWLPTLALAQRQLDFTLTSHTKSACPIVDKTLTRPRGSGDNYWECTEWTDNLLAAIERERPDVVVVGYSINIVTFRWSSFQRSIEQLAELVPHVLVIQDTPRPNGDVPDCVAGNLYDPAECAIEPRTPKDRERESEAVSAGGATQLVVEDWFCRGNTCPVVLDDYLLYRDDSHISTVAAWLAAPHMIEVLRPLVMSIRD